MEQSITRRGRMLWCSFAILFVAGGVPTWGGADPLRFDVHTTADLIAAASACNRIAGGTMILRPGDYLLPQPLVFTRANHVNLWGSGWTTVLHVGSGDAIVFDQCSFCTVRDLMIVGDTTAGGGSGIVYRGYSSSNTVEMLRVAQFPGSGLRYEGTDGEPMSSNSVRNCQFIGNRGDQLFSRYNNDFFIIGNQFGAAGNPGHYERPHSGVWLEHSSAGTYSMNYHWGNRVALCLRPGCHFNRIENNRLEESGEEGLLIGDPTGSGATQLNIFLGNTIHTNSQSAFGHFAAVAAFGAHDTTFVANQVFSWDSRRHRHRSGLVLDPSCRRWIIRDNLFRHHSGPALVYDASGEHIVGDNMSQER